MSFWERIPFSIIVNTLSLDKNPSRSERLHFLYRSEKPASKSSFFSDSISETIRICERLPSDPENVSGHKYRIFLVDVARKELCSCTGKNALQHVLGDLLFQPDPSTVPAPSGSICSIVTLGSTVLPWSSSAE